MLPNNSLISSEVNEPFLGAGAAPCSDYYTYRDGVLFDGEPEHGLDVQVWGARINSSFTAVEMWAENKSTHVIREGEAIEAFSFAFDQAAKLNYIWKEAGVTKFRYWDSEIADFRIMDLGAGIRNPRMDLDDKRINHTARSDIIVAYIKESDNKLYYRQQRDRFTIERVLLNDKTWGGLQRIGMSRGFRMMFEMAPFN